MRLPSLSTEIIWLSLSRKNIASLVVSLAANKYLRFAFAVSAKEMVHDAIKRLICKKMVHEGIYIGKF